MACSDHLLHTERRWFLGYLIEADRVALIKRSLIDGFLHKNTKFHSLIKSEIATFKSLYSLLILPLSLILRSTFESAYKTSLEFLSGGLIVTCMC